MDVKTKILDRDLEEETYMKKLEAFVVKGKKELVCKLKKPIYSLKQSPRMWYQNFDTYNLGLGFVRSKVDRRVYNMQVVGCFIYEALYVEDMLLVGINMDVIKELKTKLFSKCNMKDIGVSHFILGMDIQRDHVDRKFWLS